MEGFYSIDNFKLCLKHYQSFLERQHSQVDEGVLKDALYRTMMAYKESPPPPKISLRELNNLVLNGVRRDLAKQDVSQMLLDNRPKSSILPDETILSSATMKVVPVSKIMREDIDQKYEQILNERELQPFVLGEAKTAMTEATDDQGSFRFSEIDPAATEDDRLTPSEFARFLTKEPEFFDRSEEKLFPPVDTGDAVQPPPSAHTSVVDVIGYVSANGFDRDWVTNKHRHRFHVDFQKRFRNVTCFRATCLIVPMEIQERASLVDRPKTYFVNDYGLAYPYVLLQIDEFGDVYDGSNAAARRAFAKFVFESSYRAPNGRGYMILRPVQNEAKRFHQAPLASLSAVTLAVQKPTGALYNNSIDDFTIAYVQYEIFNRMYIKIVTDKFFDRNEFYVGDTILIRDFKMYVDGEEERDSTLSMRMRAFFDRPEGHDIVVMGRANAQGFHNNFYVMAPGALDQLNGKFALDDEFIGEIERFSQDENSNKRIQGHVINTSLQNTVTFEVTSRECDSRVLGAALPY
jgi:hypothetical protein